MITSAHSRSSNFSEFNTILQKFYKMISEIIVSKAVRGIFLIFCSSSFINNFMVKNSFVEPKRQRKLNILRPIHFEKNSAHRFAGLTCTNKREGFFFFEKNFFQRFGVFFTTAARLIWASFFSSKKIILYFFSEVVI